MAEPPYHKALFVGGPWDGRRVNVALEVFHHGIFQVAHPLPGQDLYLVGRYNPVGKSYTMRTSFYYIETFRAGADRIPIWRHETIKDAAVLLERMIENYQAASPSPPAR